MKKRFIFAMAAVALLFTACNKDVETNVTNDESAVQRITLMVENAGSNTRAGRTLYSSEAKQTIENVKVIITDQSDDEIVFVKNYTDWQTTESEAYATSGHGRKAEIILTGTEKLPNGNYYIYAIGYHNSSDYKLNGNALNTELAKYVKAPAGAGQLDVFTANPVLTTTAVVAEEIFAGFNSLTITGSGAKTTVVLHRQVAGVFAYCDEIPYVAGAAKLTLYASNNNKSLVLGSFAPAGGAELGTNGGNTNNKVVNGTASDNAVTKIMSLNLSAWFTSITDADSDGLIDAGANWITAGHDKFNTGSVFMGNFIIPFRRVDGTNTLVLKLEDGTDAELRSWIIKLPAGDITAGDITYWNSTSFALVASSASVYQYNIFRNHLYGIGHKSTDNNQGGSDPDPDDPQTLNTKEDLILKVNDNWEVIHAMEVE